MIGKRILIVKGSPRERGNSAILADKVAEGAKAAGAYVESYYLHGLDISPCDACDACRTEPYGGCVVSDDMQLLYPRILDADAIARLAGRSGWRIDDRPFRPEHSLEAEIPFLQRVLEPGDVILGVDGGSFAHDPRTGSPQPREHLLDVGVLFDGLLQTRRDQSIDSIGPVVGADDELVALGLELVLPEHQITVAEADDPNGVGATLLEGA